MTFLVVLLKVNMWTQFKCGTGNCSTKYLIVYCSLILQGEKD